MTTFEPEHLILFPLKDGKELFVDSKYQRGAIRAPFGCQRVRIENETDTDFDAVSFGGIVTQEVALKWILEGEEK
jgi:hypothetical protein